MCQTYKTMWVGAYESILICSVLSIVPPPPNGQISRNLHNVSQLECICSTDCSWLLLLSPKLLTWGGPALRLRWIDSSDGMSQLLGWDGLTHRLGWINSSAGVDQLISWGGPTHQLGWANSSVGVGQLIGWDGLTTALFIYKELCRIMYTSYGNRSDATYNMKQSKLFAHLQL